MCRGARALATTNPGVSKQGTRIRNPLTRIVAHLSVSLVGCQDAEEPQRAGDDGDVGEATSAAVSGTLRLEAESLQHQGYVVTSRSEASKGQYAQLSGTVPAGGTGRLRGQFSGKAGDYEVRVRYLDENDGSSHFLLRINSAVVAEWNSGEIAPGDLTPQPTSFRLLVAAENVSIPSGAVVEVQGARGGKSLAGIDYIEFVPLSSTGLDRRPSNARCVAPARPGSGGFAKLERVFSRVSLSAPMRMAQAPGDPTRWYVAQREGTVVSFPVAAPNDAQKKTVLTIPPATVSTDGEGGLLGFAFHPRFAQNGKLYFSYTTTGGATGMRSVVGRMTTTDGGSSFHGYEAVLGPFEQPYSNHNGGDAHFGLDGNLYLSFGDGGNQNDPLGHGQNKNLFFSKILRIDVDHPSAGRLYGIPRGNAFAGGNGEPATFAYGFRNPFRFSIDRKTGEVWVGDVGQNAWEEVDKVVAGGNYGWNLREGRHCANPSTNCPTAGLSDPIWEYDHRQGASVIGGVVYRGTAVPDLVGSYLFGDFVSGKVWVLSKDSAGRPVVTTIDGGGGGGWVGFSEDLDGEVYALSLYGEVYKLVAGGVASGAGFPQRLSATGCFDPNDVTKPSPGLIPYKVRSPLWSDGATKQRYFALPDGKSITVMPTGDFDLPVGSVAAKTFLLDGRRVETRLFVRHDDGGWAGYTYEWNDAGTDANLLDASKRKQVGEHTWYFPSRAECLQCHTEAAGRTLGLEVAQLNSNFAYGATGRAANQLSTLEHAGFLNRALSAPPKRLPALPKVFGVEPLADRARSYLHANCSMCHQPGSVGGGNIDLRYTTPFVDTNTCGQSPNNGNVGIANAKILAPGHAERSVLVQRPGHLGENRMPPLATSVLDERGVSVLESWANSVTSCPK